MEIRVFRTPRKWIVNPKLKYYGAAAVVYMLLSGVMLYLFPLEYRGPVLWIAGALSVLVGFTGIAMIVLGARQDPDFIHSFAITGTGELYHVLTWIPGRDTEFKSFPDNLNPSKILDNRKHNFSDVAGFIQTADFIECVRLCIEGGTSNNPFRQYISIRPMRNPQVIRRMFDYDLISYTSGDLNRPHTASLNRRTDGYDQVILSVNRI